MMNKLWHDKGWGDYLYWQTEDKKTLRKISALLKDIDRHPFSGIGKPEPLTGDLSGYWSRRIDDKNRLVYRVTEEFIEIAGCRTHYGDK